MATLVQDLRYAAHSLLKARGFAIVAIITLALGIGANTAIFSVINAVLFRPLPTEGLDRLVVIRTDLPDLNLPDTPLAPAEVVDLAEREEVFEAVAGYRAGDRTLTGFGEATRVSTAVTLGDFRRVFDVRPFLGTMYGPEQSVEGPHHVAVLSHGLWRQLSGGDPGFVGSTIELDGIVHEVIGVMPPDFNYPRGARVWAPFAYTEQWQQNRGSLFMNTVARMRPGVGGPQVAGQLGAESARWNEEYFAGSDFGKVLHATGFVEHMAGPLRLILFVLMGAVIFVLLIAAANVSSLQLVRAARRSKEVAVRSALGAGRGRLVGQLLMESILLAGAGAALGLGLGLLTLRLFERWQPAQQMYLSEIALDGTVLAFTASVAGLAALAFGTLPALRGARVQPQEVLRDHVRGATAGVGRHRLLQASVVTQIALAVVLVLGSGLMIRTLSQLLAANPGFDPENVVTAQVSVPPAAYEVPQRLAFFDELIERARSVPGIESAALVWGLPFTEQIDSSPFDIPGRPYQAGEPERHHEGRIVSGDYFRTMRIPLLRGNAFDGTEHVGSPVVAVIDETFAEQFFPGEDPVGQVINGYLGGAETTIIGVAARVDQQEVGDAPKASAYYSYRQAPGGTWRSIVVRSDQPVGATTSTLRAAVAEIDPNVPLYDVQTMQGRIEQSLGPHRIAMLALGVFAALSLLLATLGVYGVMRYTTNERTPEIGIRMALGAAGRNVVGMVLRQAVWLVGIGLAIGIAAAFIATRAMRAMLYGVSPTDPLTFVAAAAVLAGAALLSSYLPARRAARIDPMIALRSE